MFRIQKELISWVLTIICLIVVSACGSGSNSVAVQAPGNPSANTDPRAEIATETVLVPPTLLVSQTLPIQADNYWVAYRDANLGYVGVTRSGQPLVIAGLPPGSSPNPIAFDPLGTAPLSDPG